MSKNKYLFRVFDKENNTSCLKKKFSNLTINEAKSRAEKILKKSNVKEYHKNLDISLTLIESSFDITEDIKTHKMQWNEAAFSDGSGYFEGWTGNNSEVSTTKESSWTNTWLYPLLFFINAVCCLILTLIFPNPSSNVAKWTLFSGLIYSAILTVVRSNFNDNAKSIKYIVFFNIVLEFPIFVTTILALSKFFILEGPFSFWSMTIVVLIYLGVKILIGIVFDYHKLKK